MSGSAWYWEDDGERRGPESADDLRRRRETGRISPDTLVWREGLADWIPWSDSELGESGPHPPPLPARRSPTASRGALVAAPPPAPAAEPVREPAPNPDYLPRFRSSLERAWKLWMSDFWAYVGMYALMSLIFGVVMQFGVTTLFLSLPILVGYSWWVLKRLRGRRTSVDDLFFGFKRRFGDLAILNLILACPILLLFAIPAVGLVLMLIGFENPGPWNTTATIGALVLGIGCLLLLVAGHAIGAVSTLTSMLIVDSDLSWRDALGRTWRVTRPRIVRLTCVYFALTVVSYLGLILLYFGVIFSGAWTWTAFVFLYEDAFGERDGSAT